MLRTFRAFLEFCYTARRNVHNEKSLIELNDALGRFHKYRTIFETVGVRPQGFSLPRQHSMCHYYQLICLFGAPNGLCSSITESKHIKAVKEPWRRSSRHKALGQMLLTNQRLDKLAAARVDFTKRGMLEGTCLSHVVRKFGNWHLNSRVGHSWGLTMCSHQGRDEDNVNEADDADEVVPHAATIRDHDDGAVDGPTVDAHVDMAKATHKFVFLPVSMESYKSSGTDGKVMVTDLAIQIDVPDFPTMIRCFLYDQLYPNCPLTSSNVPLFTCPSFDGIISVHNSAATMYYAPSDQSGVGGMRRELIWATSSWRKGPPRYDCIFVNAGPNGGIHGLDVARVTLFFSFKFQNEVYPCALVDWFVCFGNEPDEGTGMWIVEPELDVDGERLISIIHLDCIFRAAHLIGVNGQGFLLKELQYHQSLDAFAMFYVNRFIDYHAFSIIS